jgi:hypothetical protein
VSAFLTCRVTAGGMTKGMTRPPHGNHRTNGDLRIGIVWMSKRMIKCHPNGTDHEAAAATSGRGVPRPRTGAGWAARSA